MSAPRPVGPVPAAGGIDREARRQRRRATLRRSLYVALLVLAMASVVWRWTVGDQRFRDLEKTREELRVAEAEKEELQTRILELSRRERITRYARERLGMHVARDDEVVLLPVPAAGEQRERDSTAKGEG